MAKSKIQFQKGYSLFEFLKDYGTEAQCENQGKITKPRDFKGLRKRSFFEMTFVEA